MTETGIEHLVTVPVVREWSMSYTMVHGSVRLTRLHARRHLTAWQWAGEVEDAALVVSELVTNAVTHGRIVGHVMLLRLALLEDGGLLVEVSDPVCAFPGIADTVRADPAGDEQGRGLALVRAVGGELSWFLRAHRGKTVRAQLPVPRCGPSTAHLAGDASARP